MVRFRNASTRLAFHTILEEWDHLPLVPDGAKDPAELARRIHDSFATAFCRAPCPLVGHFCRQGMKAIAFHQVAERLMAMIARQRQHPSNPGAREGGHQS